MIKEDLVSFDIAILLKEKGFDETCVDAYISQKARFEAEDDDCVYNSPYTNHEFDDWYEKDCCTKPTLQMAMKWLRKVHKLHIVAPLTYDSPRLYEAKIMKTDVCEDVVLCPEKDFNSPEEAYEAAIKYCLEHLI